MKALILLDDAELREFISQHENRDLMQFVTHTFYGKFRIIDLDISYDELVKLKLKSIDKERKESIKSSRIVPGKYVGNKKSESYLRGKSHATGNRNRRD